MTSVDRTQVVRICPQRHAELKELKQLTGKGMSRQVEDLIREKVVEERRRAAEREKEEAA